jgi:hypothetical protein
LRASSTDGSGTQLQVTLDTTPPVVTRLDLAAASDTPPAGDQQTALPVVTLVGRTEAAAAVQLQQPGSGTRNTTADAGGAFQFANVNLSAGTNNFTVKASDTAGNTRSFTRTITYVPDTTSPTITAALSDDTGVSNADGITSDPSISGTVTDPSGVAAINGGFDSKPVSGFADVLSDVHSDGRFDFNNARIQQINGGSPLSDGPHILHLIAQDALGNASRAPVDVSFTLDTRVPTMIIIDAPEGLTTAANPTVSGSVGDATSGVATLQALVDGGTPVNVPFPGGAFTFAPSLARDGSADGPHTVSLVATDRAGASARVSFSFTLDTRVDAEPLDDVVQGAGFSLTDADEAPFFDLSKMGTPVTRKIDDITFGFYDDRPGTTKWTNAEINVIMDGVKEFNSWTDNNNVLLVDPKYGKKFTFVKTVQSRLDDLFGGPAKNGHWSGANSDTGTNRIIAFLDWDETNSSENLEQKDTVKHELGHNFDSALEKYDAEIRRYPDLGFAAIDLIAFLHWQWIGQSGWLPTEDFEINEGELGSRSGFEDLFGRPSKDLQLSGDKHWYYLASLPDSNFARDYGKFNPYEDWTTTIELYNRIVDGDLGGDKWKKDYAGMTNKLKIVDEFFTTLKPGNGPTVNGNIFSITELQDYFDHAYTPATGYHGNHAP